ncbi:MAG: glycosyltransferase [Patescibacteria group bacterium]|nr:glycosyltransferase [Patescibacteria group bacterium]
MKPTLGLIARADNSGLGNMSWELARHIKFDQIQIVSNGRYKRYPDRFYNLVGRLTTDITIAIETPYQSEFWHGKRVLIPMYECTNPGIIRQADKIITVSLLDKQFYPDSVFLPWPIALDRIPYRRRSRLKTLIHNAGHGGLNGRNGTAELVKAMDLVKSDVKLIINSQIPIENSNPRIEVIVGDYENYWQIWGQGDAFIFPEKFNGLSLPIQEAMAAGYPIISTNRFPFNAYLPKKLLIPVARYRRQFIGTAFDAAEVLPADIANTIDRLAGKNLSKYSDEMHWLSQMYSWEKLKTQWERELYG